MTPKTYQKVKKIRINKNMLIIGNEIMKYNKESCGLLELELSIYIICQSFFKNTGFFKYSYCITPKYHHFIEKGTTVPLKYIFYSPLV